MFFKTRKFSKNGHRGLQSVGFTLIELLVVIAVVSILAAILMPALGAARERGNLTKCMSNIRQIGFAIEYYKEDHDSCYPVAPPNAPYNFGDKNIYMDILGSNYFHSSFAVFRCPSNKNEWSLDKRTNSLGNRMDYEINSGVWGRRPGENQYMPSCVVVLYDFPPPNWFGFAMEPNCPHPKSGGVNAYYADGHAAWLLPNDAAGFIDGKSPFYAWGLTP